MNAQYDIIIVGAGFVGLTLAFALSQQGKRIALLEAKDFLLKQQQQAVDGRAIALSRKSQQILQDLNIWSHVHVASAINEVCVSQQGSFGKLYLQDKSQPALGYVIPAPQLGAQLLALCQQQENITWFCPAVVEEVTQNDAIITARINALSLKEQSSSVIASAAKQPRLDTILCTEPGLPRCARNDEIKISASLLIVAEGSQSFTREQQAFSTWTRDYQQNAIVANVSVSHAQAGVAYQRMTKQGMLALLPLTDKRCTLVWTVEKDQFVELSDADFLTHIQTLFGHQLGTWQDLGPRQIYPLHALFVEKAFAGRLLLMGNAAHTLNPIAAQGFNLTLRDIACLTELLAAHDWNKNIMELLASYQKERLPDQKNMLRFTDGLNNVLHLPYAGPLRSLGLFTLNHLPGLKHRLFAHLLGY